MEDFLGAGVMAGIVVWNDDGRRILPESEIEGQSKPGR
jgi:hypothetical protein